ncbi:MULTISPECIES: hypothetical protein [Arthrobacter]|uniref:PknH-like extracellular domain-containing protein n=2 Tax=Arthrobacter TaxID=1663 RepID=A0ABU9KMB9_9MICC|nr:hypothetical protein [Arthrobacter sp. YJM1]MDP5227812.1 hypothetical protein [Arthrobacter sp. YJM1]
MKTLRRLAVAATAAALLGTTACSATGGAAGTPEGAGAPSPTVAFKKYDDAELATLLSGLNDSQGKPLKVLPATDLKKATELAKTMAEKIKVTPAECSAQGAGSQLQLLDNATLATALSDPSQGTSEAVNVISGLDQTDLAANFAKSKDQIDKCKKVTLDMGGLNVESNSELLDTPAKTPGTFVVATTATVAGKPGRTVVAMAAKGGVVVTATSKGGADAAADGANAVALLDSVAARVK